MQCYAHLALMKIKRLSRQAKGYNFRKKHIYSKKMRKLLQTIKERIVLEIFTEQQQHFLFKEQLEKSSSNISPNVSNLVTLLSLYQNEWDSDSITLDEEDSREEDENHSTYTVV